VESVGCIAGYVCDTKKTVNYSNKRFVAKLQRSEHLRNIGADRLCNGS